MKIGIGAVLFLIYCFNACILAPIVAEVSRKRQKAQPAPTSLRKVFHASVAKSLPLAGIALFTAFKEQVPVFGSFHVNLKVFLLAAAFLVINIAWARFEWTITPIERKLPIWSFLPHTPLERAGWISMSLMVATCEEMVYRGVLFGVVFQATGNYWAAGLVSAVFFSFSHLAWGWLGALSIAIVAIVLQWLVLLSGGLYAAIAVHFIYNSINGIVYGAMDLSESASPQHLNAFQIRARPTENDSTEQ